MMIISQTGSIIEVRPLLPPELVLRHGCLTHQLIELAALFGLASVK